jgi:hypothetical protein
MGDTEGFVHGVKLVIDHVSFDRDVTVSVFETTIRYKRQKYFRNLIRVLGGLLSSHMLIHDRCLNITWYDGQLLRMAADVGGVSNLNLFSDFISAINFPLPKSLFSSPTLHSLSPFLPNPAYFFPEFSLYSEASIYKPPHRA